MAVFVCVPCAAGQCDECRQVVNRGRVTRACSCRHGAARPAIVRSSDPRKAGGAIVTTGTDTLLDTRNAVIVDGAEVCKVGNPSDGVTFMALFLEGRLNHSTDRSAILHLLGPDGAAALVSQLVGLAARMGPDFETEFRAALDARMDVADLWPAIPEGIQ